MLTQTLDQQYLAHTYNRFPLEIVGGKGSLLRGADGREYIDLGSGIGVNIFGMDDDEWRDAVTAQLGRFQHVSNLYYSEPAAKLAQMLCERTGLKRVFFSNSGAESNECAIKAARKWAAEHKGPDYCSIITLRGSFHGRTLGTLAATGQDVFHRDYQPLPGGFLYAQPGECEALERLAAEHPCAAILFEAVQGEGGVIPLEREYVHDLAVLCARGADGATTVTTTMMIAHMAGIKVFATGGIGGVHRGAETTMDISADLEELASTPVMVVCAGAKSILDLGLTLEYLETMGVPVLGYNTDQFPAFYCRKSGFGVDYTAKSAAEIAKIARTKWDLGLAGGMLIGNPVPEEYALDFDEMSAVIDKALAAAEKDHVHGKNITPYLLAHIVEYTGGKSLATNIQLAYNNARLAAKVAVELAKL